MAAPLDLELKKAFTELQAKVIDTQQKVKLADIQIEQLSKTKKHAHLTDTEIMTLVDETRMYEGVGRMFILQSKGVIHNQLLEKQRIAEEKIKELECLGWVLGPTGRQLFIPGHLHQSQQQRLGVILGLHPVVPEGLSCSHSQGTSLLSWSFPDFCYWVCCTTS
uniref:Prefoldin subunit 1 n=1 Tax=Gallus gallus TaxID=9031 RepID=A0A8V0Y0Z3_CHICK